MPRSRRSLPRPRGPFCSIGGVSGDATPAVMVRQRQSPAPWWSRTKSTADGPGKFFLDKVYFSAAETGELTAPQLLQNALDSLKSENELNLWSTNDSQSVPNCVGEQKSSILGGIFTFLDSGLQRSQ